MKHLKIIIALIAMLGIIHMTYSAELSVDSIDVINGNTVSVTLSENPNLEVGEIQGEIRVLNDMTIRGGYIDETWENRVEILLEEALKGDTNYSLLTVSWADGSIDFLTPSEVDGYSVVNIESTLDEDIESIEIINDRTMLVTYRQVLEATDFEYKLLAESNIIKIEKPDYFLPELIIHIEPPFISGKNYILMFIELQDVEGTYLEFDTGIYDFTSPNLEETNQDETEVIEEENQEGILEVVEIVSEVTPEDNISDNIEEIEEVLEEVNPEAPEQTWVDLNAAGPDSEGIGVLQAADAVTQTPDTWAETWVLIIATLVINSFYYLSRRKKLSLAL